MVCFLRGGGGWAVGLGGLFCLFCLLFVVETINTVVNVRTMCDGSTSLNE